MLPKVNEADMAGMVESIKEYLRSCHGIVTAPLACIARKTVVVQTHDDYPSYATPDEEVITRM